MLLIQLTGLSGSGKTTLAAMVKRRLELEGTAVSIVDGDEYRKTLCADLGFSKEDRCENIRRLGEVAIGLVRKGSVVIIAAINPYRQAREALVALYGAKTVFIDCPLPVLIARDTKGLYGRALQPAGSDGYINNLTGVNDVYEAPFSPDLRIDTSVLTPGEATGRIVLFVKQQLNDLRS